MKGKKSLKKALLNRIVIKGSGTGREMAEKTNRSEINQIVDYGGKQINLVLQFPDKSRDDYKLQEEIRAIMATELLRQMKETAQKRKG